MPTAVRLQLRGGTTAEHSTFTGAEREVTINTDNNSLVIHDGATAGGYEIANTSASTNISLSTFTLTETGGELYFAVGGVNVMKIDASGNIQVAGDVDSNATIT